MTDPEQELERPAQAVVAAARRRVVALSTVLAAGTGAAGIGLAIAIGGALESIAAQAAVGVSGEVEAMIGRAQAAAAIAVVVAAASGVGCLVWVVRRYERALDGMRTRLEAADEASRDRARATRRAVVDGLVHLAGSRDADTREHLSRIRRYVRLLGEELSEVHPEVDELFIEMMVETSPLHDIGKVGVSDEVLLKPGPLTDEQRRHMEQHVTHGLDTLIEVRRRYGDDDYLRVACEIAFAHHERFDGTGYPFGLAGETIPLAARIVAVADVYDALRTQRVYKDAYDHATARSVIVEHGGTHFDPDVVAAFLRVESRFEAIGDEIAAQERGSAAPTIEVTRSTPDESASVASDG